MPLSMSSEEVKLYLPMIQSAIGRMAGNSASCKTWCVTLVTALFALAIDKSMPAALLVGLFPLSLLLFLDAYYLSIERDFVALYDGFVKKLRASRAEAADAYSLTPGNSRFGQRLKATLAAFGSLSVWPFYGLIFATLVVTYLWFTSARQDAIPAAPPAATPAVSRR